jgi:hypothetical protein
LKSSRHERVVPLRDGEAGLCDATLFLALSTRIWRFRFLLIDHAPKFRIRILVGGVAGAAGHTTHKRSYTL